MNLAPSLHFIAKACLICAGVIFSWLFTAPTTHAHDIDVTGVARLFLDERAETSQANASDGNAEGVYGYSLSIVDAKVPPLIQFEKVLPQRCTPQAPTPNSYRFSCNPRLSSEDSLLFPWALAGVVLVANWHDGSSHSSYFRGDGVFIEIPLADVRAPSAALGRLALRYLELGIEHILLGFDHLLFVVGLMLLLGKAGSTARYLKTITAFTLAYSVTLAAASLGLIRIPVAPVEILIALSIILLAREALFAQRAQFSLSYRNPWVVAFIFGLIHGLGFASALGNLGLNPDDIPVALLFFNLGVEGGQLLTILVCLTLAPALLAAARRVGGVQWLGSPEHTALVATTALTYLLGGIATYWFIERLPSLWV